MASDRNRFFGFFCRNYEYLLVPIGLALFILVWQELARHYPPFILPSPGLVLARGKELLGQGVLYPHFQATFFEAVSGFTIASVIALPLSYLFARYRGLERIFTPYVVGLQAIPIVALAPLLVVWFGFGSLSKVLVAGLVSFFPLLTNGVVGFRQTDPRRRELLAVMGASRGQIFGKLEVPSALPILFGGAKMGLTLSVIGAVVGEFAGSGRGLGFLVNMARGSFDTPLIFLALFLLAVLGIGFYLAVLLAEFLAMPWKRQR